MAELELCMLCSCGNLPVYCSLAAPGVAELELCVSSRIEMNSRMMIIRVCTDRKSDFTFAVYK